MRQIIVLFIITPFFLYGQPKQSEGIKWKESLSWEEVVKSAKMEGKYIFVDCAASWCQPCKYMDKEVFNNSEIIEYLNDKFIAVKFQMDTSRNDDENIKKNYQKAHDLSVENRIISFPTFLFFSPTGQIVHKNVGSKNAKDFRVVLENAMKPEKQYFTLLDKYRKQIFDYSSMNYLARTAQSVGDIQTAYSIAQKYIDEYLFKLSEQELMTEKNIQFINDFIQSSTDKGFSLFYNEEKKINQIMAAKNQNFALTAVDHIIYKEDVAPILYLATKSKTQPKWKKIHKNLRRKYDAISADRIVLNTKLSWYENKKNWKKYLKSATKYFTQNKNDSIYFYSDVNRNHISWNIFLYSKKTSQLKKAIAFMDGVKARNISSQFFSIFLDTYANLLYKIGRREDAIEFEEQVIKLDPQNKEFILTLSKMKQHVPTW